MVEVRYLSIYYFTLSVKRTVMLVYRCPNTREKSDASSMFLSLFTCRTSHHYPITIPHNPLPAVVSRGEDELRRTAGAPHVPTPPCRRSPGAKEGWGEPVGRSAGGLPCGRGGHRPPLHHGLGSGEPCAPSVRSPLRREAMPPVLPPRKGGRAPLASQPTACRVAFRRQRGRTQGRRSSGFGCFGIFLCCNRFILVLQLYFCYVAIDRHRDTIVCRSCLIVVNMLHSRSRHVASVLCECFKIRSKYFDVTNINFRRCGC
jgi:hypothetical protein